VKMILLIVAAMLLQGCASLGVEPWERDLLSQDEMIFGSDSMELGYEQHTYFSKEATSGGSGFSGGGCGCN
jgi:Domain of unknown function (DUF4266)